ncbi:unnamed protein product, partial [Didymodactylos carnosus]
MCPVIVEVEVEPKNKSSPCIFKVIALSDAKHDPEKEMASRPLTGTAREAIAKDVHQVGALRNFSEIPSMDALKTAKQQYNQKYRLDEDYFKELRTFRYLTHSIDHSSEDIK